MDWLAIILIAILTLLIALITIFLVSLSKKGDEMYEYIKTKSIINSFYGTIAILFGNLLKSIFNIGSQSSSFTSNLNLLILIAIIFLTSLIWNKRKLGI